MVIFCAGLPLCPEVTASRISPLSVVVRPGMVLLTSTNHCVIGNASTTSLKRSETPTFCVISSSARSKLLSRSHVTNFSRASKTVCPAYAGPAASSMVPFGPMTCTISIGSPAAFCFSYISKSTMLCAGVTPSAPVPNVGSTSGDAITLMVSGCAAPTSTVNVLPI